MTNEQIRIKIAKKLGWTGITSGGFMGFAPLDPEYDDNQWLSIPNYPEDLNACHEMEKQITFHDKEVDYLQILQKITKSVTGFWLVTATASQRCEAFLRTFNLWEE